MLPSGSDSEIIRDRLPCPDCGSRDNVKLYSDGHTHCFGCGAHHSGDTPPLPSQSPRRMTDLVPAGDCRSIPARKITEETARHFGYSVSTYKGTACQLAPYYDRDGNLLAQKVRLPGKDFKWIGGDLKDAMPFGWHAFGHSGKHVVLTEGEIDALSMSQVQGNKWPVWSIPCGAGPQVRKWLAHVKDQGAFDGFETVILMFDSDEKGREAAKAAAEILGSKAKLAELPLKDASEMLVAGRVDELVKAMWGAQPFRPEGIVGVKDVRERVLRAPSWGKTYPWKGLTDLLYGHHHGEVITWSAGTGVGKTDALYQVTAHLVLQQDEAVGAFLLESTPEEVAKAIAGKHAGQRFHLPGAGWTQDELVAALDALEATGRLYLYDSQGEDSWDAIASKIEFLFHAHGVRTFLVDHVMALVADAEDERKAIDRMMKEMRALVIRLGITIHLVSHLNRPATGKAFEEGGQVSLKNLRSSGGVAAWSWIVLALERDQQSSDPHARTQTTLRVLKMRRDGSRVGRTLSLRYDENTGLLNEADNPFTTEGSEDSSGPCAF